MKYWNAGRLRKVRERRERRENVSAARAIARMRKSRTYTAGDMEKNSNLMLNALGLPLRRQLLMRLQKEGAMSLSKLGRPFGMKLPRMYGQMQILERSGLITTHKRGRVRMCVFNRGAFNELSAWLMSHAR
ncbi:MAG: helix-turn-helix domain-containing protein [Patescibacteria group bacterium]